MFIINPSVKSLQQGDNIVSHVARCARVCYDKETGNNDQRLCDDLIQKGHWSMFRHASYYAIIPHDEIFPTMFSAIINAVTLYIKPVGIDVQQGVLDYYVVYNGNFALDHPEFHEEIGPYHVSPEYFAGTKVGYSMMRYTFEIVTQNIIAKDLNRVSPNNIAELSTRYVDLKNGAICRPHWLEDYSIFQTTNGKFLVYKDGKEDEDINRKVQCYVESCNSSFKSYEYLTKAGLKREDARGVLPLDTATKVIYTYSVDEWKAIIKLRTGKDGHPNYQIIANMIKSKLKELGYVF